MPTTQCSRRLKGFPCLFDLLPVYLVTDPNVPAVDIEIKTSFYHAKV